MQTTQVPANRGGVLCLANVIKASTGSWHLVFAAATFLNFLVVRLALFVLRPLRRKQMESAVVQPLTSGR